MKFNFYKVLPFIILVFHSSSKVQSQDYHWQFNNDQVISTNGYPVTLENTHPDMFIAGKIDKAISFSDANQFPYSKNVSLGSSGSYSISFWVNTSSSPVSGEEYFIANKRDGGNQFQIFINDCDQLEFYLYGDNTSVFKRLVSNKSIVCNRWSHVVITVSNENNDKFITLYINGIQVNKEPFYFTPNTLSSTLVFGSKFDDGRDENLDSNGENGDSRDLKGALDGFRINAGRVITAEEIQSLANKNPEPDHRWKFDEYQTKNESDDYISIVKDSYGYKDGLMNRVLPRVEGKIGYSAVKLEENSLNYVSVNSVETSNTKSYSLSFWINPNQKLPSSSYTILEKRDTKNQYQINLLPSGEIRFHLWGNSYRAVNSSSIPLNKWTNIIITVDNFGKKIKLFNNGTLDEEKSIDFEPWYGVDQLIIGDNENIATSNILLDDVRIYNNKILGLDLISEIYNYNELPSSVNTPIKYEKYYKTEYQQYNYDPNFIPGPVTFDSDNIPYIRKETYVQTLENGSWVRFNFTEYIKDHFLDWNGKLDTSENIDTRIIFDDHDWAYTFVKVNDSEVDKNIVLYSLDKCRTWKVLELKNKWQLGLWESKQAHNELQYPPILLSSVSANDTVVKNIGINIFKKEGNSLKYKDFGIIESAHIGVSHSAAPSQVVTKKDTTYLIYSKRYETYQDSLGNPTYLYKIIRNNSLIDIIPDTINVDYKKIIGYAGENNVIKNPKTKGADGHNYGSLVIDSKGILHVVLSGHHDKDLKYTKSKKAYAIDDEWEEITRFGSESTENGHTYNSLICDKNDKLYCITRWSGISFQYRLTFMTKNDSSSDWSNISNLVVPHENFYHNWYHKVSIDRNNNLFMNYQLSHQIFHKQGGYDTYLKNWPEDHINLIKDENNIENDIGHVSDYQYTKVRPKFPSMLRLESNRNNWGLVTTQDFLNSTFSSSKINSAKINTDIIVRDNFNLYPNPSNDNINLKLLQVPTKDSRINIYDLSGRIIKSIQILKPESNINVSDLTKGIYLFEVTGNNSGTKKIIIK